MNTYQKITLNLAVLVLIFCFVLPAQAQLSGLVTLDNNQTQYPLDLHLDILEDPNGILTIDQVSAPEYVARFTPNQQEVPNLGITNSIYWVRFQVKNVSTDISDWRLAFTNARIGLADLFVLSPGSTVWTKQQAGTYLPVSTRQYLHPHVVFPLSIQPNTKSTIYLRLESNLPLRFSLSLWSADAFEQYNHIFFGLIGIFYGIIGILMLYNLLLYFFNHKITYLYYSLFAIAFAFNTASSDGAASLYLFPNHPTKYNVIIFAVLTAVFCILFIKTFLQLDKYIPWLNNLLWVIMFALVLAGILMVFYPPALKLGSSIQSYSTLIASVFVIPVSVMVWRKGLISGRYFLAGWLFLVINVALLSLSNLNLLKNYPFYDTGEYIIAIPLVVFLSLAMTDQINQLKDKANRAEDAVRESEQRFQLIYESAPLGIGLANKAGMIIQANRAFQNMLGYGENELRNMHILDLNHPDFRQPTQQMYHDLLSGGLAHYDTEAKYICKDGSPIWVRRSVSALRDNKGNIHHTFAIISNITQQKRDEEQLRLYQENLEEVIAIRTRELERSREQLTILNRASQAVNAAGLDVDKLYIAIRAASAWLVPAEVFAISLVDRSTAEFEDVFLADGDRRLPGERHSLENSVIGRILASGNSVKVDDFKFQPAENWGSHWAEYCPGVRSGIAVLLHGDKEFLGILSVQSYQPNTYQDSDLSALESLAAHASIAIENLQLHQQAQKAVVVEERQRLARELHDSVTQILYSIALLGGGWSLKARKGRLPDPMSNFAQIEELSLQALKEMRLLIYQLRPPLLDELGLVKTLQHRLETVEQRVNIDARLKVDGDFPGLPRNIEEQAYHIVQEALNNALRHAHASIIEITMLSLDDQVEISIEDNGKGIDPSKRSKGMGMQTMRERAKAIGAEIRIDSVVGQGTKVELIIGIRADGKAN